MAQETEPLFLEATAGGVAGFDCRFYQSRNPDLGFMSDDQLFAHFVEYGYWELREFRLLP